MQLRRRRLIILFEIAQPRSFNVFSGDLEISKMVDLCVWNLTTEFGNNFQPSFDEQKNTQLNFERSLDIL